MKLLNGEKRVFFLFEKNDSQGVIFMLKSLSQRLKEGREDNVFIEMSLAIRFFEVWRRRGWRVY